MRAATCASTEDAGSFFFVLLLLHDICRFHPCPNDDADGADGAAADVELTEYLVMVVGLSQPVATKLLSCDLLSRRGAARFHTYR
eukprot:scaffold17121_cov60-Attheya_sp.AAC.9